MLRCLALGVLAVVSGVAPVARAASSCGSMGVTGTQESVEHEGSLYYVTTPETYSEDTAWPLIIGLHGDEGDPADSVNWFWRDVPDGTFIFVAPKAPNESGSWYEEQESNGAWMDGLVDSLLSLYNVDLDRIYLWGLSGGAVFSSRYVIDRQDIFAAVELNMGASGYVDYEEPQSPACKIPARFVVSLDDFLRDQALSFQELLQENGHEVAWVDADCSGHCFDEEQAGPLARDWLLMHTLCGNAPMAGCLGAAGAGGMTSGGGTGGGDAGGTGGMANPAGGAGAPALGGSDQGAGGASAGANIGASAGQVASGGTDAAAPTTQGTTSEDQGGCACALPRQPSGKASLLSPLLLGLALRLRRRRR